MGLEWVERVPGRDWDGLAADGLRYAVVVEGAGLFGVYVEPRGCGHDGGLWLGGAAPRYATAQDAMEAADRHVVAHVDVHPPRQDPPHVDRRARVVDERSAAAARGWRWSGQA